MRLENFVPTPRSIASDVKAGLMSNNEFTLYMWLRVNLNPYGVVSVALKALKDDIFNTVSLNYINKLLLSLLSKKYIYYPPRQGRRGSFEVHMGDLVLPNKQIKTLEKFFTPNQVRSEGGTSSEANIEGSQKFGDIGQKLGSFKTQLAQGFAFKKKSNQVRTYYNDNETKTKTDKLSIAKNSFNGVTVESFKPTSSDYMRCHEIAIGLGEKGMDFILSVYSAHGLGLIERAWGLYKEQTEISSIQNPPAYFNGIIQQLLHPPESSSEISF